MISDELRRHPDLVAAILSLTHYLDGAIEQLKAEIRLAEGSRLHVNEVPISGRLRKYAYYRLTPTGEVLQGWDKRAASSRNCVLPTPSSPAKSGTPFAGALAGRCA
jgi:hypothetical protein